MKCLTLFLLANVLVFSGVNGWSAKEGGHSFSCQQTLKSEDYLGLAVGSEIAFESQNSQKLLIEKVIDDGHKALVFKVQDEQGKVFAFKVARSEDPDILKSITKEPRKVPELERLKLRYARIYQSGENYILKEWVEGKRGDAWMKDWIAGGAQESDLAFKKLAELFAGLAVQNTYVGNLKDLNLIFDGHEWVLVDIGSIREGESQEAVLHEYEDVFKSRWLDTEHRDLRKKFKTEIRRIFASKFNANGN